MLQIGKEEEYFTLFLVALPFLICRHSVIWVFLLPSERIKSIGLKANQRAYVIHRCFLSVNVVLLVHAFVVNV